MNYELIMLQGVRRMKTDEERYAREAKKMALRAFGSLSGITETFRQTSRVAETAVMRENCTAFCNTVISALKAIPKGYRALLIEAYIKKTAKELLCVKYNVKMSGLYRELAKARKMFERELRSMGADEEWFFENFGDLDWVKAMAKYEPGKGGRLSVM